ncbi:potassium channel family protein [Salinibaculum rarum]|uniref:potassium channel family protein n=1 Tax=Salinibaculum rarum TaxID=3058903 RepID=UPI00265F53E9|nr:NAD-binding protein [Salinibaculum sp. KK48]
MNRWQRRTIYYLFVLTGFVFAFTLVYQYGMTNFENRPRSFLRSLQIVVETFTTTGFGSDAPWETTFMNVVIIAMDTIGTVMIFLALPVFLFPAMEDVLSTSVPGAVENGLSDHVVIATFSPRADTLISELEDRGVEYVLVEPDRDQAATLRENDYNVINAEPDVVDGLRGANVAEARALVADVSDRVDTSIVLTAREISEDVRVVSVVEDPDSTRYHELAGADVVLSPRPLLGERLAEVISTGVTTELGDGIEVGEDFEIAELLVHHGSPLAETTLATSGLRERTGVNVIGAWFGGEFQTPVDPDRALKPGTVLLVSGREHQLEQVEQVPKSAVREFERGEVLVVGHGQVGQAITSALAADGQPYTVLNLNDAPGVDVVGTASDENALREAGIEDARSVILAIPDDTETEFATLVMRDLNTDLDIAARTEEEEAVQKMYRAGANYVLSLAQVAGRMTASAVLDDETVISMDTQVNIRRTEAPGLVGQTLADADVRTRTGCTVIAVERDGKVQTNVGPDFRVESGDRLIIAGTDKETAHFRQLLG